MPIKMNRPPPTRVPGIVKGGPNRYLVRSRWTDPKTGAASMDEAIRLQQALKGRGADRMTTSTRQRFADYAAQWLRSHVADLSAVNEGALHRRAGQRGRRTLGEQFVDSRDERDIQEMARRNAGRGLREHDDQRDPPHTSGGSGSPGSAGRLGRNPARDVRVLRERRTTGARGTSLSAAQLRRVMDAIERLTTRGDLSPDIGRILQTLAWTGMRKASVGPPVGRLPGRRAVALAGRVQSDADEQAHQDRRPSRRSGRGTIGSGAG